MSLYFTNNFNKALMYHSVGGNGDAEIGKDLYQVPDQSFRQQMKYLLEQKDIAVTLTFDDGGESDYKYVFPILKEMGFIAYFFILPSKVGRPGHMRWLQIKELSDSGMIIGSHGMTHRILTELTDEELDHELIDSKRILEENLGQTIDYFSIPRGFYNPEIIKRAKQNGYRAVFTSNVYEKNGFKIGRIPVMGDWSLEYFIQVISKGYSLKDNCREATKSCLKKLLGVKFYDKLRTKILAK